MAILQQTQKILFLCADEDKFFELFFSQIRKLMKQIITFQYEEYRLQYIYRLFA
jgi:hypothetical protein